MVLQILSDLDGTLLPRPFGTGAAVQHPNLSRGPAFDPLCRLLALGCTVVGVTGSRLVTHRERFFEELPTDARRDGRVLLSVQTGVRLYRGSSTDGSPVEDMDFAKALGERIATQLDQAVVDILIETGRRGLSRFFEDLASQPDLVDASSALGYLLECKADEIPVTQDNHRVPRIEVRDGNSAVVFVGVPSTLGARYFSLPASVEHAVEGKPTGRATFDCVPRGLDKSHVVAHLIERGVLTPGRTIALGDQPAGNDEGLTRWHQHPVVDIPFVSVSEKAAMVPEHLRECHVTAASNAEGSAIVLRALADRLAADANLQWSSEGISALVRGLNEGGIEGGSVGLANSC